MSRPSHIRVSAFSTLVLALTCSALIIGVIPVSATAQTRRKTTTHSTIARHRPVSAHAARHRHHGSHGGGSTTPPPVTTPPSTGSGSIGSGSGSTGSGSGTTGPGTESGSTGSGSGSTGSGSTGSGSTGSGSGSTGSGSGSTGEPAPEPQTPLAAFPGGGRPFAVSSPWNVPIPANPVLDPNSTAMAGYLGSEGKAYADLYEYGNPVWEATSSTPAYNVTCTEEWGTCQLSAAPIPIPASAGASSGSDGSMVVIDWSTRTGYDFWRARKTSSGWSAAWGTVFSIDGMGTEGGATGAGVPLLAGIIRTYEIEQGYIDHALAFATDNACEGVLRYPASKTDGSSSQSDCTPEGARVQLNPSIDVDAIPGITPAERMIAHALQTYGAYAGNNGGAKMAFSFQNPVGEKNPYPAAGLAWDYYDMPHIPWNQLRVLETWNGS